MGTLPSIGVALAASVMCAVAIHFLVTRPFTVDINGVAEFALGCLCVGILGTITLVYMAIAGGTPPDWVVVVTATGVGLTTLILLSGPSYD